VAGAGQLGSLQEPGEQQAAQSIIVGKTRLIADNRANSILVIGQPEAKQKVGAILSKLDKRPLQVYLATVIGQLRVSNADDFSVNILQKYAGGNTGAASIAGGRNFTSTNTPLSSTAANMAAMANVAQAALGGLPGVQIMTFIGNSLNLYIQALTATARFRIASRPAIFTANNKKAVIFNGQKIAVPTSTVTTLGSGGSATATSGSQQSNIQYQDVVLKIEVVPLINSAREISLQIIQTNDTLEKGLNSTTDIGGGVQVPKINTQELTTSVIVPDRATILLGGLVTQTDEKATTGVPFLSTIPLMGNLFKSTSDTTDRQELVVMMQPSVIGDTPELKEISRTERDLTGFSSKELAPVSMRMGGKNPTNPPIQTAPDSGAQSNKRSWDMLWSKNGQE
jgi:type II secretory pathway component GspD/PulD (secretin)